MLGREPDDAALRGPGSRSQANRCFQQFLNIVICIMRAGGRANRMISEDEIRELKKTHDDLAERAGSSGGHRPVTVKLSKQLKLLMAEIEELQEKGKSAWNPAVTTRVKMAKKAVELSKDSVYFERWAASEFQ